MPIDARSLRGTTFPSTRISWGPDDVILYHLAIGAGDPPTDEDQLAYVYERGLAVLPTFATLAAQKDHLVLLQRPEMDVAPNSALHGEQEVSVTSPLPVSAEAVVTSRVSEVDDKGSSAVVRLETETRLDDGTLLSVNRSALFFRGEGGFGNDGPPAPPAKVHPPERDPDVMVTVPTLPQQALLYRLTGDKALLHADPRVAVEMGFDSPILHGLCTFGIACRVAVDTMLGGKIELASAFRARFSAPAIPGETLQVKLWEMSDNEVRLSVSSLDRDVELLSQGSLWAL